jgi:hypothetical protein
MDGGFKTPSNRLRLAQNCTDLITACLTVYILLVKIFIFHVVSATQKPHSVFCRRQNRLLTSYSLLVNTAYIVYGN